MRRMIRLLLYLFPRDFRAQYGEEITEYAMLRAEETRNAGFWSAALLSVSMIADLSLAALRYRMQAVSASGVTLRVTAITGGFVVAFIAVGGGIIAFEAGVRQPLLHAIKTDGGSGALGRLAIFTAVIAALLVIYARILPSPNERRQTAR